MSQMFLSFYISRLLQRLDKQCSEDDQLRNKLRLQGLTILEAEEEVEEEDEFPGRTCPILLVKLTLFLNSQVVNCLSC